MPFDSIPVTPEPVKPKAKKKTLGAASLKGYTMHVDEAYFGMADAKMTTAQGILSPVAQKAVYGNYSWDEPKEIKVPSLAAVKVGPPPKAWQAEIDDDFAEIFQKMNQEKAVPNVMMDPAAPPVWADHATPDHAIAQPAAPIAPQAPEVKLPSLKALVESDEPFDVAGWSSGMISHALDQQGWHMRAVGETMLKGDLVQDVSGDIPTYERIDGWADMALTEDLVKDTKSVVWTIEGGGKPSKPVVLHTTDEFASLFAVPKGVKVKMPTNQAEAERFFGCAVISTEVWDKTRPVRAFYPVPSRMVNKRFRSVFSRVFSDFAKNHFRECMKSVIPGRGDGVRLKKGVSPQKIRQLFADRGVKMDGKWTPLSTEQLYMHAGAKSRLDPVTIQDLVRRQDYQPLNHKISHDPYESFAERMANRPLIPDTFGYDKAIGIEIEAISLLNAVDLTRVVPHYVRVIYDGSLRSNEGKKLRPTENYDQAELAKGYKGQWGVEFQILIKRSDMERQIRRVLDSIGRQGCYVNQSCGLHVHFDMRDKTEDEAVDLAEKVKNWLILLRELLPQARRQNNNCAFENPDKPHHAAVATDCYHKKKTIEVRVHSSTLSQIKLFAWIRLLDKIMTMRYTLPPKTSCLDALKVLDLPREDHEYWTKRHHQLNPALYPTPPDSSFLGSHATELE